MPLVRAEVAGSVWRVEVAVGQRVAAGDALVIVESMKMEIPVEAGAAGIVSVIHVAEGDIIAEGAVIAELAGAP